MAMSITPAGLSAAATLLLFSGCASEPANEPSQPVKKPSERAKRIDALNKIADDCGLSRSTFRLEGEDRLEIRPTPGTKFEAIDCGLTGVKKLNLPLTLGIIGNEVPSGSNSN